MTVTKLLWKKTIITERKMNNKKKINMFHTFNNYINSNPHNQAQTDESHNNKKVLKSHEHHSEVARNEHDAEIEEDTPMKRKYKNKQKKRFPSNEYKLKQQTGKFQGKNKQILAEKKIQEAETVLNNSKNSIKKSLSKNNSINLNNSLKNIANNGSQVSLQNATYSASKRNNSNSINKSQKNIDQVINNHNEVQVLNKKIMQLKKQSEQDKQLIIKKRLRNNELQEKQRNQKEK
ncbi:hypothetical protein TTHERM_00158100 (macronuclear) [Tetrahymena thermophila SB210]|uniref:Uncharacterized protein n=1 Tax=Tetrahymena thermophila (strain SB210) TaxID=312017 RepID=Q22WC4_TETTS|nr:hypothetical protein TTHERM_00158100 [Tetrahymena thermophila SB210]EAR89493.2 hypothetical protein TTHERM_00158100 [Tetrahymena thermophila SB210]|eukprot:XP_001009738.2 hypothetical protein TTHERM_00158100 [Tetrahymena thermophila SB210]